MRHLAVVVAAALLGAGCATVPSGETVQDFFSPPREHPGPTWTRDGEQIHPTELTTAAGPDHCEWQTAVMMHLGWPLGTRAETSAQARQFVRDPDAVVDPELSAGLEHPSWLPDDARDTRYRLGDLELWLSPSDADAAYLRHGSDVERWPRADPVVACS